MKSNEEDDSKVVVPLKQGLPAQYVQIIAFVFLVAMFIADKIMQAVKPPLEDYWYIGLATIAFFGASFAEKFMSRKP